MPFSVPAGLSEIIVIYYVFRGCLGLVRLCHFFIFYYFQFCHFAPGRLAVVQKSSVDLADGSIGSLLSQADYRCGQGGLEPGIAWQHLRTQGWVQKNYQQ